MATLADVTLRERLLLAATGKTGIFLVNALFISLSFFTLQVMLPMITNAANNVAELEDISEYMGVILIGYGVAVEERHSFMKIFKLYPKFFSQQNEYLDEICHEYGLFYLLLGLFMEMCVACIKIPNVILNTTDVEYLIFGVSAFFLAWNTILMVRHCYFLVVLRQDKAATT